jgi:hypothetical protein
MPKKPDQVGVVKFSTCNYPKLFRVIGTVVEIYDLDSPETVSVRFLDIIIVDFQGPLKNPLDPGKYH